MRKVKEDRKKLRGIFKRISGSGVWWIRFADRPYHIRREKAGTRSQAKDLLDLRTADVLRGQKLPPTRRGRAWFSELAEDALADSRGRKKSWTTDTYRMPKLVGKFGERIAEDITPAEIETWLASHERWSTATKNRYRALLKMVYTYAERDSKKITVNPMHRIKIKVRGENNERERFLNQHEPLPTKKSYLKPHTTEETRLRAVIRRKYARHQPELDVALHCGLRPAEQYGLLWTNVDLPRRILLIPESKHGKARRVPLNDSAMAAFETLRRRKNDSNHVFISEREKENPALRGARHWFNDAVEEAGLREVPDKQGVPRRFRFYDIRHTFGTRLSEAGVPIKMVSKLMGHRNVQTTMRYLHTKNADELQAVQTLMETPEVPGPRLVKKERRTA